MSVEPKARTQPSAWFRSDTEIGLRVSEQSERCLRSYKENPLLVTEHANIERATAQGGYGRRQIFELVQNAADALIDFKDGRVEVCLTKQFLYCANEGHQSTLMGRMPCLAPTFR